MRPRALHAVELFGEARAKDAVLLASHHALEKHRHRGAMKRVRKDTSGQGDAGDESDLGPAAEVPVPQPPGMERIRIHNREVCCWRA